MLKIYAQIYIDNFITRFLNKHDCSFDLIYEKNSIQKLGTLKIKLG
jgi:hypothetical protein